MGIVRFALRFPHTFYVVAGLMLFLGGSAILVTPKDIFPPINIPVVPELPGRTFHGTVARHADALDQQTRTMLTEVDVDNADGTLAAGLYGVVHLWEPRPQPVVRVPSQAVIFDKDGLSVAVFDNGVARLRHLDLEADEGAQVAVRAGLRAGEVLIVNPPVGVTDGMKVATAPAVASR
jgi:multidrug efflux pump subunit AcrA (membrane-fusion protein)